MPLKWLELSGGTIGATDKLPIQKLYENKFVTWSDLDKMVLRGRGKLLVLENRFSGESFGARGNEIEEMEKGCDERERSLVQWKQFVSHWNAEGEKTE